MKAVATEVESSNAGFIFVRFVRWSYMYITMKVLVTQLNLLHQ